MQTQTNQTSAGNPLFGTWPRMISGLEISARDQSVPPTLVPGIPSQGLTLMIGDQMHALSRVVAEIRNHQLSWWFDEEPLKAV